MDDLLTVSLTPPPGWAADTLSRYFENARNNRFATFFHKPLDFERLRNIDKLFLDVLDGWRDPGNSVAALLVFRSHSAFRAACEHAAGGQVAETFPLIRATLEYAAYSLRIADDPTGANAWLARHTGPGGDATSRSFFRMSKIETTIKKHDARCATIFSELYQRSIDFGAHPNQMGVLASMRIKDIPDGTEVMQIYLHDDGTFLDHALRSTAQSGVCSLDLIRLAFPSRFSQLKDAMDRIRLGL